VMKCMNENNTLKNFIRFASVTTKKFVKKVKFKQIKIHYHNSVNCDRSGECSTLEKLKIYMHM